jgi:hypothetical protein
MSEFENFQFRILDLSLLDRRVLEKQLSGHPVTFEDAARNSTAHHELATIAVVGGLGVLMTAAAYLFGKRKTETISFETEVITPKGIVKKVRLNIDRQSVEPMETQILGQLKAILEKWSG